MALAYGWLAVAVGSEAFWAGVLPPMILAGIGMAMVVAPLSAAVMGSVPEDDSGSASGINNAVSRVAGLLAVAALGGVAAAIYAAVGGSLSYGEGGGGADHVRATTRALAAVAWNAAALAALSAALALRIGRPVSSPAGPRDS